MYKNYWMVFRSPQNPNWELWYKFPESLKVLEIEKFLILRDHPDWEIKILEEVYNPQTQRSS